MLVDTHLHTFEYSADSFLPIAEAVARAREMGVDGLCVTDHDSLAARPVIREWRRRFDFPLFLGVEILTTAGDFVVFGLDMVPRGMPSPQELLAHIHDIGGAAVAAHPYRNNGRGAGSLINTLPGLDGVECFNGSTPPQTNLRAWREASKRGVALLGAADSHLRERVGLFVTDFDGTLKDEGDLIAAVKERACAPMAWTGSGFTDAAAWSRERVSQTFPV